VKKYSPYKFYNNYVLRTPLFAVNFYLNLTNSDTIDDEKIKSLLNIPLFAEALYLASPDLFEQYESWTKGKLNSKKKIESLKASVLKYTARISSRCTPFGLFAGCSVGEFNEYTDIKLNDMSSHKKSYHLDTILIIEILNVILDDKKLIDRIKFYPNNSLYRIGNQYRYIAFNIENHRRVYNIEGLVYSEYIEFVLNRAKKGVTIFELIGSMHDDEISKNEARSFILDLVRYQILVPELEVMLTRNTLNSILESLEIFNKNNKSYLNLSKLKNSLQLFNNRFNSKNEFKNLHDRLNTLGVIPNQKKHILQCDLYPSFKKNYLNKAYLQKIKEAIIILNKISLPYSNSRLEEFKRKFKNRYQTKELPLLNVLDTEVGIGYGNAESDINKLVDEIQFQKINKDYRPIIWTTIDQLLLEKLNNYMFQNSYTIILNESDITNLKTNWHDLPDTMSGLVEFVNENNKDLIFIENMSGSSAANIMARFGDNDEAIKSYLLQITEDEEKMNQDKILAEIIHLPQSRTGNILKRPQLRKYEIPYLGKSSLPLSNQIPLSDIMVSVRNNKVHLRSKKYNKEVLPKLSNTQNYRINSLPCYCFLCDVQNDNIRSGIRFSWNTIFETFTFLPRVQVKDVIFSLAKWNIKVKDLSAFFNYNNKILLIEISKWRNSLRIPQFVQLVESDNKLLINFKNVDSIKMLLNTVKNSHQFQIEEFLYVNEGLIKNDEGHYCNQFILSMYNANKLKK